MPKIFNENNTTFKLNQDRCPDFSWHTTENLAKLVNAQHMNFNIRSLDPDKFSYPYHFHRNAEEMFVILSGKAILRTPEGLTEVAKGDIIFFEIGESSAHQLYNHTKKPCVFLDICTNMGFDVCGYPDSKKMAITQLRKVYQPGDEVDYFKDEDTVREFWNKLKQD